MTSPEVQPIIDRLRAAGDDEAADAILMLDDDVPRVDNTLPAVVRPAVPIEVTAPATHHSRLEAALQGIQKPVTAELALEVARGVLPSAQFAQFSKWMQANGGELLGRLNG